MTIEDLYEQYHAAIYKYVCFKLGSAQQAEDVTQDIFVKAMRHFPLLPEQPAYGNWLYRIATNHCIDLLRHDGILQFSEIAPDHAVGSMPDVGMQECIGHALSCMSASYRQALLLYYHHGYTMEEVAHMTGYKLSGMKMLLK